MEDKIKPYAKELVGAVQRSGYKCYIVGGAIRDILMGKAPEDYDFTTNAPLTVIKQIFSHKTISTVGEEHGTIVIHWSPKINCEITRFRRDASTNGRHADVIFVNDINMDLARRDFTINAIAYDPVVHEFIDPFNGREDVRNKQLKFVGDPKTRILEDHLRAIRYFRFSADFHRSNPEVDKIVHETYDPTIVSLERIYSELTKLSKKKLSKRQMVTLSNELATLGVLDRLGLEDPAEALLQSFLAQSIFPLAFALQERLIAEGTAPKKVMSMVGKVGRFSKNLQRKARIARELKTVSSLCLRKSILVYPPDSNNQFKTWAYTVKQVVKMRKLRCDLPDLREVFNSLVRIEDLAITAQELMDMGYKGGTLGKIRKELHEVVLHSPHLNTKSDLGKHLEYLKPQLEAGTL